MIVVLLLSFALASGDTQPARSFDLQRVLNTAAPASAMRAELKDATSRHQHVLDCMQARIRALDERIAHEKSEPARKALEQRRAAIMTKLQELFATMRRILSAAEKERVTALTQCADRHAASIAGADRTDAVIKAMDADRCDAELKGRHAISQPSDEQRAELCAKD